MTSILRACSIALLVAGCSNGPVTLLDLDIRVDDDSVAVYAREVERACTCSAGEFPAVGTCETSSDGISCTCDPPPATCLESFRIERGDQVVHEEPYDRFIEFGYQHLAVVTDPGDELVIEGCGGEARIPLGDDAFPRPTITDLEITTSSLELAWTTDGPATSALVSMSDGFGGALCHDAFAGSFSDAGYHGLTRYVSVDAVVRREVTTELGQARVWIGGSDRRQVEPLE
jgi:hypothetical protein